MELANGIDLSELKDCKTCFKDRIDSGKDGEGSRLRKILTVRIDGARRGNAVAFGENPSTARTGRSDMTITKLSKLMECLGFSGLTMLNLYESSSAKPEMKDANTPIDITEHAVRLDEADAIFIVWGSDLQKKRIPIKDEVFQFLVDNHGDKLWCVETNGNMFSHPRVWKYSDKSVLRKVGSA